MFYCVIGCGFKCVGLVGFGKLDKVEMNSKVWWSLGESIVIVVVVVYFGLVVVVVVDVGSLFDVVKKIVVLMIVIGVMLGFFEDMRFKFDFKKL